jgi:hypothetical protein
MFSQVFCCCFFLSRNSQFLPVGEAKQGGNSALQHNNGARGAPASARPRRMLNDQESKSGDLPAGTGQYRYQIDSGRGTNGRLPTSRLASGVK